jgi:hypothetical protein
MRPGPAGARPEASGEAMRRVNLAAFAALLVASSVAQAAKLAENHFATIYIDNKKSGQVHYTVEYGEDGDLEQLKTNASVSVLGIKLFNFTQDLHERWLHGELQDLNGHTNDDGKIYDARLERGTDGYTGSVNEKSLTLPAHAFPASVWHYAITEQTLLFELESLKLMNVKVVRAEETLKVGKKSVPTERFDFSGDWKASIWFDQSKTLVRFTYWVDKHKVTVEIDE